MEAEKSLNKLKKIKPNYENNDKNGKYKEDNVYKKIKDMYQKKYNLKIDKKK